MKNSSKKNVKIIALVIVAFFALSIVGIAVTQTQVGFAAPAQNSAIGVVDANKALRAHPDFEAAAKTMQQEGENAQKEFEEKAANLPDQEKQRYATQLQQRLQQKEADLISAIGAKVEAAVKKIATAKGFSVVVRAETVVYGGTDITEEVIKAFSK